MGSYIPFSEEQREQARRTDLAAFLRQCGEEVRKSGTENMWLDHGQKVTIRGNLWFHQYEQVGGDAIDFACRFYGMDYPEAVQLMLSMGVATVRESVEPFPQKPLELPPKHENMRRVYGYLIRRRGIDKDVLDAFAYRGLMYESADYHNAVFVGTDREGKSRHVHKHSTAAQGGFKGNAPGSEPEYSFHWIGGGDILFLFEAPVDMLSFITLHKQCWKSSSYAAACGVSDKVLWQTLKDRPYIRKVCICLDNDEIGQKAAQRISKVLGDKNIENRILVPTRKDWKLNAFLDTELEQVLCFDGGIDAELFVKEKSAIFLILPEEDATKNFVASLMIQNLARELFSVANEHGGKLPNRAVFFCDELGTMPPFDILPLFSAGRSRRLMLVPIIQSLAQLEKNYGKEGAEILCDNCQDTIFGGFAPNSQTAAALSENLGSRTVLSGSVTQGKDNNSQSLQMMERPLMSPDELKSMPKGSFVVMKTGTHPMKTKLKLFFEWGIRFEKPLQMEDRGSRPVHYAGKADLEKAILSEYPLVFSEEALPAKPNLKTASMPEKTALKT